MGDVVRISGPADWEVAHARALARQLTSRCCAEIEASEVIEALGELRLQLRAHPAVVARAVTRAGQLRRTPGPQLKDSALRAQAKRDGLQPGEVIEAAQAAGWEVI